jgi:hypothetical protein
MKIVDCKFQIEQPGTARPLNDKFSIFNLQFSIPCNLTT